MDDHDRLQNVAARWMREIWQERRVEAIDEIHTRDFVDRSPAARQTGNQAYQAGVLEFFEAFPDFTGDADDWVVDTGARKVAFRWSGAGTHTGSFLGIEPTGKRIVFRGIEILRIEGDKVAERWGEWDGIDLLEQLGHSLEMPQ